MGSIAAREVAKEVLENLGKGKKISLRKIAVKKGYKQNTADNPKNITETKSYQDVISPIVKAMELQRQRALEAIGSRKLTKDKTRDLVDLIDKLTKNIQLLTGGKTDNTGMQITWE